MKGRGEDFHELLQGHCSDQRAHEKNDKRKEQLKKKM